MCSKTCLSEKLFKLYFLQTISPDLFTYKLVVREYRFRPKALETIASLLSNKSKIEFYLSNRF